MNWVLVDLGRGGFKGGEFSVFTWSHPVDEQGSAGLEQEVRVVLLIVGLGDVAAGAPDLLGPGPFGGQPEVGVLAESDLSAESGTDGIGPCWCALACRSGLPE